MTIIRQGDVLLVAVASIPKTAKKQRPDNGRVILAYGEVTGHSHAINNVSVAALYGDGLDKFLKVMESTTLQHEEHSPIQLPSGDYRVIIQKEYTPQELRDVKD